MSVKQKLGKTERLQTVIAIEKILETYCRPCDLNVDSTRHTKPECIGCTHYKDLRALGDSLGGSDFKEGVIFSDEILAEAEKNGITRNQLLTRYNRGMPLSQIAAKKVRVQRIWRPEDDEKLLELLAAGMEIRDMTEILNRSMDPIRKRIRHLQNQ